jgi:tRNA(His) 5'-end guanylyltransferase
MNIWTLLQSAAAMLVLGSLAIIIAYGVGRAFSFAWFRSRLEFHKRRRRLTQERCNGL